FFADDWVFALENPKAHVLHAFAELHPYNLFRPLPLLFAAVSQSLFGATTLPTHLVQLVFHPGLCFVLYRFMLRCRPRKGPAFLAGAYVDVSQAAVSSVGGNDTLSLTMGTFFGVGALFLLTKPGRRRLVGSLLLYALALLSKESSLGYAPLLVAMAWWTERRARGVLAYAAWLVAVTGGYLAWRHALGGAAPHFGPGPRELAMGFNVIRNIAALWAVTFLPVSSVRLFVALFRHDAWTTAWCVGALLATLAICLRSSRIDKRIVWIAF